MDLEFILVLGAAILLIGLIAAAIVAVTCCLPPVRYDLWHTPETLLPATTPSPPPAAPRHGTAVERHQELLRCSPLPAAVAGVVGEYEADWSGLSALDSAADGHLQQITLHEGMAWCNDTLWVAEHQWLLLLCVWSVLVLDRDLFQLYKIDLPCAARELVSWTADALTIRGSRGVRKMRYVVCGSELKFFSAVSVDAIEDRPRSTVVHPLSTVSQMELPGQTLWAWRRDRDLVFRIEEWDKEWVLGRGVFPSGPGEEVQSFRVVPHHSLLVSVGHRVFFFRMHHQ